jgi:hypothetical protein
MSQPSPEGRNVDDNLKCSLYHIWRKKEMRDVTNKPGKEEFVSCMAIK